LLLAFCCWLFVAGVLLCCWCFIALGFLFFKALCWVVLLQIWWCFVGFEAFCWDFCWGVLLGVFC
jgi:hypothetical protein